MLYVLAVAAIAIALFALVLPEIPAYTGLSGLPENDFTVSVTLEGDVAVAKNNLGSELARSNNHSAVFQEGWDSMVDGGRFVFLGNFTFDTPTTYTLVTDGEKSLYFEGLGVSRSWINFNGSGFALNFTGESMYDTDFRLGGFAVSGVSKTEGRSGIVIDGLNNNVFVDDIWCYYVDVGVQFEGSNANSFLDGIQVYDANDGLALMGTNGYSGASQIYCRELMISTCTENGVKVEGGHNQFFEGGIITRCNVGIWINASTLVTVNNMAFEYNEVYDLWLAGHNSANKLRNVVVENGYFASPNANYAVYLGYASSVKLSSCYAEGYNISFVGYDLVDTNSILFEFPTLYQTDLINATASSVLTRTLGRVVDARGTSLLCRLLHDASVGDVVYEVYDGYYGSSAPAGSNKNPAVVTYSPVAAGGIGAVGLNGVFYCKVDAATTRGDVLVVKGESPTQYRATVNNTETDSSKILGSAYTAGGGSDCYVLVN